MTITSDLRGFALVCDEQTKKTLLIAADRIDAEHAKLREERDTYRDLVGMMDHPDVNAQLQAENDKLRKLVRCLVNAEHPLDRATLIANAAYMLAELGFWEVES